MSRAALELSAAAVLALLTTTCAARAGCRQAQEVHALRVATDELGDELAELRIALEDLRDEVAARAASDPRWEKVRQLAWPKEPL